jgi:hypothetical protein
MESKFNSAPAWFCELGSESDKQEKKRLEGYHKMLDCNAIHSGFANKIIKLNKSNRTFLVKAIAVAERLNFSVSPVLELIPPRVL